jgi:archaellin
MPTDVSSSSTDNFDTQINAPAAGDPRTSASVRNPLSSITNRARFIWNRVQTMLGTFLPIGGLFPVAATVDATANTFTITGHGLANGDPVEVWAIGSGSSLPSGLAAQTTYFVVNKTTDTFQVAASAGGSAIDLTSTGSGVYVTKRANWMNYKITSDQIIAAALTVTGIFAASGTAMITNGGSTLWVAGLLKRDGSSSRYQERPSYALTDADHTIHTGLGDNFGCATPTAQRTITLQIATTPTPLEGETITIARPSTGNFSIIIKREGSVAAIVTLPGNTRCAAILKYYDTNDGSGVTWHLVGGFGSFTPGADA